MPIPEEQPTTLKDVLLSLFWLGLMLGIPVLVISQGSWLPRIMVWPAWGMLAFMSFIINVFSVTAIWTESALPYRGVSPVAGGPGMRTVAYHSQLQKRVGRGSALDWLNWWVGLFLRVAVFLAVLIGTVFSVWDRLPASWHFCGFLLAYDIGVLVAGLIASFGLSHWMRVLGDFWSQTEPPELPEPTTPEGIGVAQFQPAINSKILALAWKVVPLPTLLLALTALPLLAFPEQGIRLAWLGLALSAILGYPVWTWSDYRSRRLLH